ncbi:hypothetical protein V1525DRAFT_406064 [Lipomyces kononenkoae]|uniref:Uncharacterized protein n=1 Tax=Lipomyces kononenkoae TaxID=34357 RepID=A0ACC3SYI7_LIPKO
MRKRRQPLRPLEQARLQPFEVAKVNRGYIRRSCSPQPRPCNQADILKFVVRSSPEKEDYDSTMGRTQGGESQRRRRRRSSSNTMSKSRSPELTSSQQTRRKRRRAVPSSDAEDYDYLSSDSSYSFLSPIKNVGLCQVEDWHDANERASLDDKGRLQCSNSVDIWNNKKMSRQIRNELSDGCYSSGEVCHDKDYGANQGDVDNGHDGTTLNEYADELIHSEPVLEVKATAESETVAMDSVLEESRATIGLSPVAATGTRHEDYVPDTYAEENQADESVCAGQEDERTRDDSAVNGNCLDSMRERIEQSYSMDSVGESSLEYESANQTPCIPSSEWSECESLHSDTDEPDGLAGLAYATPEWKPMTFDRSFHSPEEAARSLDCRAISFGTRSVPSTQQRSSTDYNYDEDHDSSPLSQHAPQSQSLLSTGETVASQPKLKTKPQSLSNTQVSGSTDQSNIHASDNSYADHLAIGQSDCRIENTLLTDSVMFSLPLPPEMKLNFWQSTQLSEESI